MIDLLPGIKTTASALNAERIRMDVVGQNIANAQTTRGPDGNPYQRKVVVFEEALNDAIGRSPTPNDSNRTIKVARIEADDRQPRMVHKPSHPHADADGMVAVPDINIHEEMVDMITSSRAFEANLSVVKTARSMAAQALEIGKR